MMNGTALRPKQRKYLWTLAIWILASLTQACAPSRSMPTTASCAAPPITPCRAPIRPAHLETQADLLSAYIDALAAWAECRAEVEKVRNYYESL